MKKRKILIIIVVLFVVIIGGLTAGIWYYQPYNSQNISRYPCITIDESEGKQYICDNEGYAVYTINLKEVYFVDTGAKNIDLEEALTTEKITIKDMLGVCRKETEDESKTTYSGENYKIILNGNECLITPKDYEINN